MGKEVKISFAIIGTLLMIFGVVLYHRLKGPDVPLAAAADSNGEIPDDGGPTPEPQSRRPAKEVAEPQAMSLGGGGRNGVRPASRNESAEGAADAEPASHPSSPFLAKAIEPAAEEPIDEARQADALRSQADAGSATLAPADDPQLSPSPDTSISDVSPAKGTAGNARRPSGREVLTTSETASPADAPDGRFGNEPRQSFLNRGAEDQLPADAADPGDRQERGDFAEPAAAKPRRVTVQDGKYTVQPNDNYWTISEKVYGTGGYFKAIQSHNRAKRPRAEKLQVGDVLSVPEASVLAQTYPKLCPKPRKAPPNPSVTSQASTRKRLGGKTYVVEEGDTLFDIARYRLGKASRWAEIYDLNRDVLGEDFDYLQPGTELVMPSDRRETESVTRRGGSNPQR